MRSATRLRLLSLSMSLLAATLDILVFLLVLPLIGPTSSNSDDSLSIRSRLLDYLHNGTMWSLRALRENWTRVALMSPFYRVWGKRGFHNCTQGQGIRRESGRVSNRYTGGPEGVWTCRRESGGSPCKRESRYGYWTSSWKTLQCNIGVQTVGNANSQSAIQMNCTYSLKTWSKVNNEQLNVYTLGWAYSRTHLIKVQVITYLHNTRMN